MKSVRNIANREELPELGSKEAAVLSCVSLIAGMCGQPEAAIAYWLDLYYQVRCAYEAEGADEANTDTGVPKTPKVYSPKFRKPTATDNAIFKRETWERLSRLRERGLTVAEIREAGAGEITDDQIMSILECKQVPVAVYRVLAAALDKIEG